MDSQGWLSCLHLHCSLLLSLNWFPNLTSLLSSLSICQALLIPPGLLVSLLSLLQLLNVGESANSDGTQIQVKVANYTAQSSGASQAPGVALSSLSICPSVLGHHWDLSSRPLPGENQAWSISYYWGWRPFTCETAINCKIFVIFWSVHHLSKHDTVRVAGK